MKNKKTIYNSDEFRKTVQCLTEKIREADELESVDVDKSFQDVMKRVGSEKPKHYAQAHEHNAPRY